MRVRGAPPAPHPEPVSPEDASAMARTGLAWSRSGLANLACGVVIARGLPLDGTPARPVVGLVVVVLGLLSMVVGAAAARHRGRAPVGASATMRDMAPLAVCSSVVGVAVLALDLVAN